MKSGRLSVGLLQHKKGGDLLSGSGWAGPGSRGQNGKEGDWAGGQQLQRLPHEVVR